MPAVAPMTRLHPRPRPALPKPRAGHRRAPRSARSRIPATRRILELGTSNGFSTIWLADARRSHGAGRLVTVDVDPARTELARRHLGEIGLEEGVELRSEDAGLTLSHANETRSGVSSSSTRNGPRTWITFPVSCGRWLPAASWPLTTSTPTRTSSSRSRGCRGSRGTDPRHRAGRRRAQARGTRADSRAAAL